MSIFKKNFPLKRLQLFEIEDQSWCPKNIRNGVTDFLQHIVQAFSLYKSITPLLTNALHTCQQSQVIDLCSGGTGPWPSLAKELPKNKQSIKVTLTDLYPNQSAFHRTQACFSSNINYLTTPIDATQVPKDLIGFRTLFSSFHHLNPSQAQALLQNAVDAKSGIAIFESTQRHPINIIYMLFVPFLVLILTPFIRPFSWGRLFWTYMIPTIPLIVLFHAYAPIPSMN